MAEEQMMALHGRALEIETRIAAQLGLSLRPQGPCETTRDPAYRRARVVVRRHTALWAEWTQAERLRWQIAMTASHRLAGAVKVLPIRDRADVYAAALPYLFTAAVTWDPARAKFSTHARSWIRAGITRQAAHHAATATVRLTATGTTARRIQSTNMSADDVAEFGFRRDTLDAARGLEISSLDRAVDGHRPIDGLRDDRPSAEDGLAQHESIVALRGHLDAIARVLPRQVDALKLYYGLDGVEDRTLTEVGARLGGISRERARQLQRGAVAAIRHRVGIDDPDMPADVVRRLAQIPTMPRQVSL